MVGIALFMGGDSTMSRAIVPNAGHAYRLRAQVLKDEFHRGEALSGLQSPSHGGSAAMPMDVAEPGQADDE